MKHDSDRGWGPYLPGVLTGVVLVLSVWITGKFIGASTSLVRTSGMIMNAFGADSVSKMDYFIKYVPKIDWQWMFVIGLLVGAFIAAITSGSFKWEFPPKMWERRLGKGKAKRAVVAVIGGAIAAFGARLAGGCPSGHGLSGMAQLSVSGFIALICFFVAGAVVARIIYGRGDGK